MTARRRGAATLLGRDAVGTLAVATLEGLDGSPHLLSDRARQKAAYGMRLPAGCLHKLLQRGSAGPFQQLENLGRFAAAAGSDGLLGASGLSGRFGLGRRGVGAAFR